MKNIISASRRTDIPACYFHKLYEFINQGYAEVDNPYNGNIYRVSMKPEDVHTLVLWSKNFKNVVDNSNIFKPYNMYFHYTINLYNSTLEPNTPSFNDRVECLEKLVDIYGANRIAWRYDPIMFNSSGYHTSIESFSKVAKVVSSLGITRCIFSFLDLYGKVNKVNQEYNLGFIDPPIEKKLEYANQLLERANENNIKLETCSEDINIKGIKRGACIDGDLLSKLANEPISNKKDKGQRSLCNCAYSKDIGSYKNMPCKNGCIYCYANPIL